MAKSTHANTQAFQSVYINPIAEKWQDRIILHDPIFQDEISGVIALKSYRLEECLGFVLNAPLSRIRYFRDKVKKADQKEEWGKLDPQVILERLIRLVDEIGGTITYMQNRKEGTPKENIEGEKSPHKYKPKKVKKGKSINLLDTPVDEKEIGASNRKIYSPAVRVYPEGLTESGKLLWDRLLKETSDDIYQEEDTDDRWKKALYFFDKTCSSLKVSPFKVKASTDATTIKENMLRSIYEGKQEIKGIQNMLDVSGVLDRNYKLSIDDIQIMGDDVFVVGSFIFKLLANTDSHQILSGIKDTVSFNRNVIKAVDTRTAITLSMDSQYTVKGHLSYNLFRSEAKALLGTDNDGQIRCGLVNAVKKYM